MTVITPSAESDRMGCVVTEISTGATVVETQISQVFDSDGRYLFKQGGSDYLFVSDENIFSFRLYWGDVFQSFSGRILVGEKYSYDLGKGVTVTPDGQERSLKIRLLR